MNDVQLGEVCNHGHLKRSCELCERDQIIAELESELARRHHTIDDLAHQLADEREAVSALAGIVVARDRARERLDLQGLASAQERLKKNPIARAAIDESEGK